MYRLKRHRLPIEAHLRRSVALAYAFPAARLEPLLGPGLELDLFEGYGFLVVALVQTEHLRVKGLPTWCGTSFFLSGYRLFVRYTSPAGKHLRGLKILRSETDSLFLTTAGNLLTHYGYRKVNAQIESSAEKIEVTVNRMGKPNLSLVGDLTREVLPSGSVFRDEKQARAFAGPMPFTFDYEKETRSMISVQGVRAGWTPKPFDAQISVAPDFSDFGLHGDEARLASAYQVENVPYSWKPGKVEKLP